MGLPLECDESKEEVDEHEDDRDGQRDSGSRETDNNRQMDKKIEKRKEN